MPELKLPSHLLLNGFLSKRGRSRTSLVIQWLDPGTYTAGGPGLIPGPGTESPQTTQWDQKEEVWGGRRGGREEEERLGKFRGRNFA